LTTFVLQGKLLFVHTNTYALQNYPSFEHVHTFILFVGYPRSGHSLVGALLNAHPDAIVSHELDALQLIQHGATQLEVYQAIVDRTIAFQQEGSRWSGYSYQINGGEKTLSPSPTHIGDKRGGTSAKHLQNDDACLRLIQRWNVQLKIIHVVRNPYDCISTAVKRRETVQARKFATADVQRKADHYFTKAATIQDLIEAGKFSIYTFHYEKLLSDLENELSGLLGFLGLPVNFDYLQTCRKHVWPQPKRTRFDSPHWDQENIAYVADKMRFYPFFSHYTFNI
jgi:hypothetical protein